LKNKANLPVGKSAYGIIHKEFMAISLPLEHQKTNPIQSQSCNQSQVYQLYSVQRKNLDEQPRRLNSQGRLAIRLKIRFSDEVEQV
jgi:hypothetical protein